MSTNVCAELFCFCCPSIPMKKKSNISQAIFVRFILIGHVMLSIWRVTIEWDDPRFWLLSLGAVVIVFEGYFTIMKNGGLEWKW